MLADPNFRCPVNGYVFDRNRMDDSKSSGDRIDGGSGASSPCVAHRVFPRQGRGYKPLGLGIVPVGQHSWGGMATTDPVEPISLAREIDPVPAWVPLEG